MKTDYLSAVAAQAAGVLRARAAKRKAEAEPEPLVSAAEIKRRRRAAVARDAAAAATIFPNNLGNYSGKRKPNPAPKPLTARDRFFRLEQAYLLFRAGRHAA